jgi:hypothetical protein
MTLEITQLFILDKKTPLPIAWSGKAGTLLLLG